jgi:methylenetetrahydrofolate reductase (NADPH)
MPVIPGILPVTNVKQLIRMSELTGTPLPTALTEAFAKVEANPEDVRKLGVDVATELAEKLIAAGAPGIHFYTMNSSTATREVFERIKGHR